MWDHDTKIGFTTISEEKKISTSHEIQNLVLFEYYTFLGGMKMFKEFTRASRHYSQATSGIFWLVEINACCPTLVVIVTCTKLVSENTMQVFCL